jgi:hypothetical protein
MERVLGLTYLQREVDRYVSERERAVEASAQRVARAPDLVASATQGGDALLDLFSRLKDDTDAPDTIATTVWTPHGPARAFKVLAWNEGPAENVSTEVLNRAPAFAVVQGVGGLRLIYVHPVVKGDSRVAVAASETVISTPSAPSTIPSIYTVDTAIGPLQITPVTTASAAAPPDFTIADRTGAPLLWVTVPRAQLADAQAMAHWRAASLASLPWLVWIAVVAASVLRRRTPRAGLGAWLLQSLIGAALIAVVAVIAVWLGRRVGLPDVWMHLAHALAALAIVAAIPGSAWWLRLRRPAVRQEPARWLVEQIAGGAVLAAGLARMAWLWRDRIDPTALEKWQLPVLASDVESVRSDRRGPARAGGYCVGRRRRARRAGGTLARALAQRVGMDGRAVVDGTARIDPPAQLHACAGSRHRRRRRQRRPVRSDRDTIAATVSNYERSAPARPEIRIAACAHSGGVSTGIGARRAHHAHRDRA